MLLVAFAVNRAAINRNQATLRQHEQIAREQRAALTYLCHTVSLLDSGYVQQASIAREALRDGDLTAAERVRWRERLQVFQVLHEELSDRTACRQIE